MTTKFLLWPILALAGAAPLTAAVIGLNTPARSLTFARLAALPAAEQLAWRNYLDRSDRSKAADQAFLRAEIASHGRPADPDPPHGRGAESIPLRQPDAWYGGAEARRIANIIISYQTPSGGWSKNIDLTRRARRPGESFAPANASPVPEKPGDFDHAQNPAWHYIATIDNDATTTELVYLARIIRASAPPAESAPWRAAFLRGLDYLFAAQYPNGGWPQVWPLEGGYHDAITYNDDAMANVMLLLREVAGGRGDCAFVPAETCARAAAAMARGVDCILATQIVANNRRTVWCQQHDMLTLAPCSARNYEMPAACSAESAGLMMFLLELPHPDARTVAAIHAAAAWFDQTAIQGETFTRQNGDRVLVPEPDAAPLWARYYEIGTDRPVFGDRDKTIHDRFGEISRERRNGYRWFAGEPGQALKLYVSWSKIHP